MTGAAAAGRDIATPYRTFLDQPGVPFIEASLQCGAGAPHVHLAQSRFLPRGSSGDPHKLWQVPVCVKYPVAGALAADRPTRKETCTLLTSAEGDVPLETKTCPAWVFPNAHGTGYYRFALASADLVKLRATGLGELDTRERIAFGNSLRAGFNHGSTPFGEALLAATPLFTDPEWRVAGEPAGYVELAHDWLIGDAARPRVEAYARKIAGGPFARLGWSRRKGDTSATVELRRSMLQLLVMTGRDPAARAEARRRGQAYVGYRRDGALHHDAVDENLAGAALWVAGQEADASFFDAILAMLVKTQDDVVRGRLLGTLSAAEDPKLAARARDLVLDERIKYTEMLTPLWVQLGAPETRDAAWAWLKEHWDAVAARASNVLFEGVQLVSMPSSFCDDAHEHEVATFLKDRATKIDGGPRVLAKTVEQIHLCAVKRRAEEDNARTFFTKR